MKILTNPQADEIITILLDIEKTRFTLFVVCILVSSLVSSARAIKCRNYRHCSEIGNDWKQTSVLGSIDRRKNLRQLICRCSRCRERYERMLTEM